MKKLIKKLLITATCGVFVIAQFVSGQRTTGAAIYNAWVETTAAIPQVPPPPPPNICSIIPCQVPIPSAPHTPAQVRPFFDWFSWESFIALNWPVLVSGGSVQRGQADNTKTIGNLSVPRVWESWKAEWELFRPASASNPNVPGTPSAWSSFNLDPNVVPCANANVPFLQSGGKLLVMSTKMDNVLNQVNEALAGPLIDQNCAYARYEIRVDESEYNFIVNPPPPNPPRKPFYIQANQPASGTSNYPINFTSSTTTTPFPLPSCQPSQNPCTYGAIEIKAAWREMKPGDDLSRYYTVNALLVESTNISANCRQAKMGLVGLHIGHKVSPFREWVWSTFEQVDNVPPDGYKPKVGPPPPACSGTKSPFSFNNGFAYPPTVDGYSAEPAVVNPPLPQNPSPPVQVARNTPIVYQNQASPTTQDINGQFQKALSGTVWQYYQLVVTQWPRTSNQFVPFPAGYGNYPTTCDLPIPTDVTFSGIPPTEPIMAVANTTMETYYQTPTTFGIASCMHCHYLASGQDFSFMLNKEAFVPPGEVAKLRARRRSTIDPVGRMRSFIQRNRTTHNTKYKKLLQQLQRSQKK